MEIKIKLYFDLWNNKMIWLKYNINGKYLTIKDYIN